MSANTASMEPKTSQEIRVGRLRCEYAVNPLGIDVPRPRLSWVLDAARRGVAQSAYQVRVRDDTGEVWDSDRVASDQSIHVAYAGRPQLAG